MLDSFGAASASPGSSSWASTGMSGSMILSPSSTDFCFQIMLTHELTCRGRESVIRKSAVFLVLKMWPEALPAFGIIAGCIVVTGMSLSFLNKWEHKGKVTIKTWPWLIPKEVCPSVLLLASEIWSGYVGPQDDTERQENNRL